MKVFEICSTPLKLPPLLYLVIAFKVGDGPSNVIHQRVNKILAHPHRPPAIWTSRAQISTTKQKQNYHKRQRDILGPECKPGKQEELAEQTYFQINTKCDAYQQHSKAVMQLLQPLR